ncbi:MAG: hypothetical protein M9916_00820 [Crocinitomicaceae bacterium]|nr:hypothetical protein [Crocinitomicaceae bacterium]
MAIVLVAIALFLFSKGKNKAAGAIGMFGGMALFVPLFLSGRLNGDLPDGTTIKDESGCGFTGSNPTKIDGIKLNGKRFKVVNGADVYINNQGEIKPCGFGSALMLKIGNGGYEPKSIQNDECWK